MTVLSPMQDTQTPVIDNKISLIAQQNFILERLLLL